jgi:hypothetical protein
MHIRTTFNNHSTDDEIIVAHISKTTAFEFEIIGVKKTINLLFASKSLKAILWQIHFFDKKISVDNRVDEDDKTSGTKAELLLGVRHSGTKENPATIRVEAYNKDNERIDHKIIKLSAQSKISEAIWSNDTVYNFKKVNIAFSCEGLYGQTVIVNIYNSENPNTSVHTETFIQNEKQSAFHWIAKNDTFLEIKYFFIISYINENNNEIIIYHGKEKNNFLKVVGSIENLITPELPENIVPVVIYGEEYFTQKYEPCKYEKIYYKHGDKNKVEAFDHTKPTTKDKDDKFKNSKIEISVIVPPKGSKNIKDLVISLEGVKTEECQYSEANKKYRKKSESEAKEEKAKPHKGRVIDTAEVKSAGMEVIPNKPDEQVTIKPTFNYEYDEKSAWEFMKNYFLFSAALRNTDALENEIKGYLMDAEAESKVIKKYKIPLNTCRYQKPLHLKTHADVAWAFHALFDDPYVPEYYIFGNQKTIKTVQGLDEDLDKLKESSIVTNFTATIINPALGNSFVRNFIIEIIKDIAERYEFGFTAYYDFDKEGKKNAQQIDYAETHPEVFKALIAGVVTLEILIDVLLIIITEGAALANFVSKAGKVAGIINKSSKLAKTAKKAGDILAKHSDTFDIARNARMAKNAFEFMKGSYFKGYRFVEDVKIGVQPVLEERVKISPFLNLNVTQKKSLGELLLDKTPVGMTLNMAKAATGGFGLGISAMFLRKIKVRGKEVGKQGVGWYLALTYPLKIVNYAVEGVYNLLAFATDEALRKVFGAEAEFEKDITAHIDLDFWLKIHNAEKKLDLFALKKGESKTDKSEISIAPSGAFTVSLKLSGSVSNNVVVRAMHMLTWNNKEQTKMQEMTAEGKFEVEGNVFIERRYYYKADKKPYHEDKIVFTGLAGEYEYKVEAVGQSSTGKKQTVKKQEPTQFMLIEPCQLVFNSDEMTKNPSDDK